MSDTTDPKFMPPTEALATVGLTATQLKTNASILKLINTVQEDIDLHEVQISVLITTLMLRGMTVEDLVVRTGYASRTITRKNIEGTAILRTQEVTRTTAAIRAVNMSTKAMELATRGGDADTKIAALELAAMDSALASGFQTHDEKAISPEDSALILLATRKAVLNDALPTVMKNMISYIPLMADEFKIKGKIKKPQERDPDPDGGASSAMALDFHLKRALADVRAIENAAEEAYVPTPQDYYHLLQLCDHLNIMLDLDPHVIAAIESLMA